MKTKNFSKKLSLNKETVVHLDNGQLGRLKGNGVVPQPIETLVLDCTEVTCAATCLATCAASCNGSCNTCYTCTCLTVKPTPCCTDPTF